MKKALSALAVLFLIGLGIGTGQSMPKSQLLLLNEGTKEYFAPPCLMKSGYNSKDAIQQFASEHNLIVITNGRIPDKSHPNNECREKSAFYQEVRSITSSFLEWIKIILKQESKWNEDGTWKSI